MNFLPVIVIEGGDGSRLKIGPTAVNISKDRVMGLEPRVTVTLGIRPETVGAKSSGASNVAVFETETIQVERLGDYSAVIFSFCSETRPWAHVSSEDPEMSLTSELAKVAGQLLGHHVIILDRAYIQRHADIHGAGRIFPRLPPVAYRSSA
jgi:hypothetical protein